MTPEEAVERERASLEQIHTLAEGEFKWLTTPPALGAWDAIIRVPSGQHITVLPHVQRFANDLLNTVGEDSFGTYINHEPTAEQAVDCFVDVNSRTLGDKITGYAIANLSKYGIWYVIYRQRIYNPEVGSYWRDMEDRGSPTANHFDHVHLSFYDKASGGVDEPTPPVDNPTEEDKMSHVVVRPGERLLIPVPVVKGGAGVKKAAVTVCAPDPGAIIGLAQTWRDEKKIVGLNGNPSFKGLVNFALGDGVEAVEIENKSTGVAVTVMVEVVE